MSKDYGIVKIDTITYTTGESPNTGDASIDVSGLAALSDSGITVTGTIIAGTGIFNSGIFTTSGYFQDVTITGALDVSGITVTGGGISVTGNSTLSGDLGIDGDLIVSGDATVTGDLTVSGDFVISGDITTTGDLNVQDLNVRGDAFIASGLTVTGDVLANQTITSVSGITINATASGGGGNVGGLAVLGGNISGNANGGVYGSGYWKVPEGPTAARPGEAGQPAAVTGMIRYNNTIDQFEGWAGSWGQLGGGATGSGGDQVFILNETGVTTSYTLTGFNAVSAGAITLDDGVVVTVEDTYSWSIV